MVTLIPTTEALFLAMLAGLLPTMPVGHEGNPRHAGKPLLPLRHCMTLPPHKTKIVATIGPASDSLEMLERRTRAGLNVARLNFSHGDFTGHGERIARIRAAEKATGRRVAIMADCRSPTCASAALSAYR